METKNIVTIVSANDNTAAKKVSAAKAVITALKKEALSLAGVLKVMYDLQSTPEIAPFIDFLHLHNRASKRVAVAAAIKRVHGLHPYVAKSDEGVTFFTRKKVAKNLYKYAPTNNVWKILEDTLQAIEGGLSQQIVADGEYCDNNGCKVSETSGATREAEKLAEAAKKKSEKIESEIVSDLLNALNLALRAAKGTAAEIHVIKAIAAVGN